LYQADPIRELFVHGGTRIGAGAMVVPMTLPPIPQEKRSAVTPSARNNPHRR